MFGGENVAVVDTSLIQFGALGTVVTASGSVRILEPSADSLPGTQTGPSSGRLAWQSKRIVKIAWHRQCICCALELRAPSDGVHVVYQGGLPHELQNPFVQAAYLFYWAHTGLVFVGNPDARLLTKRPLCRR